MADDGHAWVADIVEDAEPADEEQARRKGGREGGTLSTDTVAGGSD